VPDSLAPGVLVLARILLELERAYDAWVTTATLDGAV
jgi:hypothetical protein